MLLLNQRKRFVMKKMKEKSSLKKKGLIKFVFCYDNGGL